MLPQIEEARARLQASLADPAHRAVIDALVRSGEGEEGCVREVSGIIEAPRSQARFQALRGTVESQGIPPDAFARVALSLTALRSLDRLETFPVAAAVKTRAAAMFCQFAAGPLDLAAAANRFVAFAKLASLRRLPAGLFDWEVSGLPRSWLPRIRPYSQLARVLRLVPRWKAFGPLFFSHLTVCRPVRALFRRDADKSYYLMARSIELQPAVKGFITASWFHSPDTFRITPHLAWMNDVFVENGALVATVGPAEADCGVLARSPERQQAYESGRFKPTLGLVIWPREQILAWAARHPELES